MSVYAPDQAILAKNGMPLGGFRVKETIMRHSSIKAAMLAAVFIAPSALPVSAAAVFLLEETGGTVTMTASGSLDLSGANSIQTLADALGASRLDAAFFLGGEEYIAASQSVLSDRALFDFDAVSTFGVRGPRADFVSDPFQEFGYSEATSFSSLLFVTRGYTSGSAINYSIDLTGGTTFADFGFVPGSAWGMTFPTASGTDSITFEVAPATVVPVPASLPLLLGGGLALAVIRRRKSFV